MKLSIITINYNNASGLEATVKSVLSQTCYDQIEYVVVDGASSDGSRAVLESNDGRITKWVSEPDHGIYNAMNKGVGMSAGDYCLFLNSGDVLHGESAIGQILPQLDGTDFVIGKVLFLNSGDTSDISEPLTMNRFYKGSIPHPATFIKREWLLKYPYDENLRIVSDWKFFIQALIIDNAPYKFVDAVVTDFDCEGISGTNLNLVHDEREKVLKELLPQRVAIDYLQFNKGAGYSDTTYDRFFVRLRDFKYAKVIYSIDVAIMKVVAVFRKGARFVREFPTGLNG